MKLSIEQGWLKMPDLLMLMPLPYAVQCSKMFCSFEQPSAQLMSVCYGRELYAQKLLVT